MFNSCSHYLRTSWMQRALFYRTSGVVCSPLTAIWSNQILALLEGKKDSIIQPLTWIKAEKATGKILALPCLWYCEWSWEACRECWVNTVLRTCLCVGICCELRWIMNGGKGCLEVILPPPGAAGVALCAASRASLILCVLYLHWLSSSDQDWGAGGIGHRHCFNVNLAGLVKGFSLTLITPSFQPNHIQSCIHRET